MSNKLYIVIQEVTTYKTRWVKAADRIDAVNRVQAGQGAKAKPVKTVSKWIAEAYEEPVDKPSKV